MTVGLVCWGRFVDATGQKVTVPAPSTEPGAPWLVDFVRSQAAAIGASFDVVQWPPTSKAQGGAGAGCDGYGVFDRYDLGTKPQQGSVPTRYGPLEGLLAAVAALAAHGVESYGDLVLHQVIGENGGPGVFDYLGADGKTKNGRGAVRPSMLRGGLTGNDPIPPFCPEDDVPQPDNAFGREFSYQHCSPPHTTTLMAVAWIKWLRQRVGYTGFRVDDAKGIWAEAMDYILTVSGNSFKPFTEFHAEYFDGPDAINAWVEATDHQAAVEDFPLHFALQRACNGYDARELGSAGYWQWRPELAVGFVDNPDTDLAPGQSIVSNKLLAYAYLLTLPCRMAMVYGKDYFGGDVWPGAYGLKPQLDNLLWIARMFAFGKYAVRYVDRDVHVATRDGDGGAVGWSGGLLTAVHFNPDHARTITCATCWGPGRQLHDYTGRHHDIWTDGGGRATFTLPANTGSKGQSFLCFAPGGRDFVDRPFRLAARKVTQTFFGAPDLDVPPVKIGMQLLPQRIRCAAGVVSFQLTLDRSGLGVANAWVMVGLHGENEYTHAGTGKGTTATGVLVLRADSWVRIVLTGDYLPDEGVPFELRVTYLGAAMRGTAKEEFEHFVAMTYPEPPDAGSDQEQQLRTAFMAGVGAALLRTLDGRGGEYLSETRAYFAALAGKHGGVN